jgi:2-amino-4-hydroxy-6-hydroxymethyldihydropteridine diphosphokinase
LEQLQDNGDVTVLRRSGYYETSPVENTDQPFFINGVVEVDTRLSSRQLLDKIKVVETLFNIQPRINKGPRVIDLDILLYGDEHIDSDQLQLPHPAICRRKFVRHCWKSSRTRLSVDQRGMMVSGATERPITEVNHHG